MNVPTENNGDESKVNALKTDIGQDSVVSTPQEAPKQIDTEEISKEQQMASQEAHDVWIRQANLASLNQDTTNDTKIGLMAQNMADVSSFNPNTEVEKDHLSESSGAPRDTLDNSDVLEAAKSWNDTSRTQAQIGDMFRQQNQQDADAIWRWYSDVYNARVAKNDVEQINSLAGFFAAGKNIELDNKINPLYGKMALGESLTAEEQNNLALYEKQQQDLNAKYGDFTSNFWANLPFQSIEMGKDLLGATAEGAAVSLPLFALNAVPGAGTIPYASAFAAGTTGAFANMLAEQTRGASYRRMRGMGIDPKTAAQASIGLEAVSALTATAGIGGVARKGATELVMKSASKQATEKIGNIFIDGLKSGAFIGGLSSAQSVASDAAVNSAIAYQNAVDEQSNINQITPKEIGGNAIGAFGSGSLSSLVPIIGFRALANSPTIHNLINNAASQDRVGKLNRALEENPTVKTGTNRLNTLWDSISKNHDDPVIFIDADGFRKVFGDKAGDVVDALGKTAEFEQSIPGDGTRIPVRLADYMSNYDQYFRGKVMQDFMSDRADAISKTQFQIEDNIRAIKEQLAKEALEKAVDETGYTAVRADVSDSMIKAGFKKGWADKTGAIVGSLYSEIAKASGVEPYEFYKKNKINWQKSAAVYTDTGSQAFGALRESNLAPNKSITIAQYAPLKTVFHEVAHDGLHLILNTKLDKDSEFGSAANAVMEAFGIKDSKSLTRDQDEAFANQFTHWLLTGMEPVEGKYSGVEPAFRYFAKAAQAFYGQNIAARDFPIAHLFAKLLGAKDAVARANEDALIDGKSLTEGIKDPVNVGVTRSAVYRQANKAFASVINKLFKGFKGDAEKVFDDALKEADKEVSQTNPARAIEMLSTGKLMVEGEDGKLFDVGKDIFGKNKPKLSTEELDSLLKEQAISQEEYDYLNSEFGYGTMSSQDVANFVGYTNDGISLLHDIYNLSVNRDKIVEQFAVKKLIDGGLGVVFDDNALMAMARNAILSDDKYAPQIKNLNALKKLAGMSDRTFDVKAEQDNAKKAVGKFSVSSILRDPNGNSLDTKISTAARRAVKFAAEGNYTKAVEARIAHLRAQIKRDAIRDIAGQVVADKKYVEKLGDKLPMVWSANPVLSNALNALTNLFSKNLGKERDLIEARNTFIEYTTKAQREGFRVELPAFIKEAGTKISTKEMTVDVLHSVKDFGEELVTAAKHELGLKKAMTEAAFVKSKKDALSLLQKYFPKEFENYRTGKYQLDMGPTQGKTLFSKIDRLLHGDLHTVLAIETLVRKLDGHKKDGWFARNIFWPFADGASAAEHRIQVAMSDMGKLIKKFYIKNKVDIGKPEYNAYLSKLNGRNIKLTKEEVLNIALNCGNESSLDALTAGNLYRLDKNNIREFLSENLDANDIQFVNEMMKLQNRDSKEVYDSIKRWHNGEEPDMIKALPMELKNGKLTGGYWHLEYNNDVRIKQQSEDAYTIAQQLDGQYTSINNSAEAFTAKGFAKEREGSAGKIVNLSFDSFDRHIRQLYNALELTDRLQGINRFLHDKDMATAMDIALGNGTNEAFLKWLHDNTSKMMASRQPLIRALRTNTTMAMLLYKLITALINGLGAVTTADEVGVGYATSGFADVCMSPFKADHIHKFILANSDYMNVYNTRSSRELAEIASGTARNRRGVAWNEFQRCGMAMLYGVTRMVNDAAWIAGYRKFIDGGHTHADAVRYADSVVRMTQGTGAKWGQSGLIANPNEWQKLWTVFGTYGNMIFNRMNMRLDKLGRKGFTNLPEFVGGMMALLVIPAIGEAALRGKFAQDLSQPKNQKDFLQSLFVNNIVQVMPAGGLISGRGAAPIGYLNRIGSGATKMFKGKADWADYATTLTNFAGIWSKIPASQMANIIEYADRCSSGQEASPLEILSRSWQPQKKKLY